jgi:hypothetical protein
LLGTDWKGSGQAERERGKSYAGHENLLMIG